MERQAGNLSCGRAARKISEPPRGIGGSGVGVRGFEPRTSALSELRSSQLSYTPSSHLPVQLHTIVRRRCSTAGRAEGEVVLQPTGLLSSQLRLRFQIRCNRRALVASESRRGRWRHFSKVSAWNATHFLADASGQEPGRVNFLDCGEAVWTTWSDRYHGTRMRSASSGPTGPDNKHQDVTLTVRKYWCRNFC